MCRVLKVSRSGVHSWLGREESGRARENKRLDALIRAEYETSKKRSGSIKITRRRAHRRHPSTGLSTVSGGNIHDGRGGHVPAVFFLRGDL